MLKHILSETEQEELQRLVAEATTIVISCHTRPDGDAIGSTLGLAEYLRTLGKDPQVIIPDQYPDFLQWMPNTEKIIRYDKKREQADLLIATADLVFLLDLNQPGRLGGMEEAVMKSKARRVLVDHHLAPTLPCTVTVSHPEMCSTCELVFRIVWQMGAFERQTAHFAAPIYCGMMTDTGGFTYNSNSPDIFYIISQLLTKGIDKDRIYRNVYNSYSENRLRLMGYVLYEKMVTFPKQHAALFSISRKEQQRFHFIKGDAEGLVNIPLQMKGTKLSISLREDTEKDNCIRISLRSVDDFPCNRMAEQYFNGGGHLNASGGELLCSLDEAVERTKKAIMEFKP